MSTPSNVNRPFVRQLIRALLPTDSDFLAFCGDYFPDIAGRFSSGMDRVAKTSLLLDLANPAAVAELIHQHSPTLFAQHMRLQGAPIADRKNPYRGLAAFQTEDANLFFGRESLTATLWQRFEALYEEPDATRLLAILGPSGSGKSSVARAGLLAALLRSPVPGPQPMRFAIIRPGERPIESLARALVPLLPPDCSVLPASRQIAIEKLLRDKEFSAQALRRFAADLADIDASPLCIVIDQFEEIYTLCGSTEERDAVVAVLLHAAGASDRHISVVLTLRSDFLGETQRQHPSLNRVIAAQHEIVPALSPAELRTAIVKPAEHAGRQIDEITVEFLLAQASGRQGALPLLEFALAQIWEGMERGQDPGATLRNLGGVGGALAGEAQRIFDSLSEAEQATARRALVRLVRLGEGSCDTRRRVPVVELCGRDETEVVLLSVLRKFAVEDVRLLTLSGEGTDTIAEVTHEALFDHWAELRTWLDESRRDRGLHDRAFEAAKLWTAAGQPVGRLWRPPDLDLLRNYQQRKPEDINPLQGEFLAAGIRQQQKETTLRLSAALALLFALLSAAGIYIAKERQRTQEAKSAAEKSRQQLLDTYVDRGHQLLFTNGDSSAGLLWLHRAYAEGSRNPILPHLLKSAMQSVDATKLVLTSHGDQFASATFSPDGRRILTRHGNETALLWDSSSGAVVAELKGHTQPILSAVFSPDGRRIATASYDNTTRIWHAENGRLLVELDGHDKGVWSVAFSSDGGRLINVTGDQTTRLWETESGRLIYERKSAEEDVADTAFGPDGPRVLTRSDSQTARIWSLETGRLVTEIRLPGHRLFSSVLSSGSRGRRVYDLEFSPDGHYVVILNEDHVIRVWEAESGRLVSELNGAGHIFMTGVFSPDSRRFATLSSSRDTVQVWEVEQGRLLTELNALGNHFITPAFSPDGHRIVILADDHTARVWDADSGSPVAELKGHGDAIQSARFSPDGRRIVTASADHTMRIWDADGGRSVVELKGHGNDVRSAKFSPDGRRIVTASDDQTARIWNAVTGGLVAELKGHESYIWSTAFSADGRRIVTASEDSTARIWNADGGQFVAELKGHGSSVRHAEFSSNGRRIVTASDDGTARIWDTAGGRIIAELKGHESSVRHAEFSPEGHHVVTAGDDHLARLWDPRDGRLISELKGHSGGVLSAVFSPDGRLIVTASDDHTARVWDSERGQLIASLRGHGDSVLKAVFSPDGHRVATASLDNTARVWNAGDGALISELKGHEKSVMSAMFSPDGRRIVTASYDHTARVWEADSGWLIAELKGHGSYVMSAAFSPDGRRIVTASHDHTARLWDASPETRTAEDLAKLIRCHVPARFERIDSNVIIPTIPKPADCQANIYPQPPMPWSGD